MLGLSLAILLAGGISYLLDTDKSVGTTLMILGLILGLLAAGMMFISSRSANKVVNLGQIQQYTDKKHGFIIELPSSFVIHEPNHVDGVDKIFHATDSQAYVGVYITEIADEMMKQQQQLGNKVIEQVMNASIERMVSKHSLEIVERRTIAPRGRLRPETAYYLANNADMISMGFYMQRDLHVVMVVCAADYAITGDNRQYSRDFLKILESFQFL